MCVVGKKNEGLRKWTSQQRFSRHKYIWKSHTTSLKLVVFLNIKMY